jgi:glyoxylase-like metal-dependent hydrolase (beta-lactamase superfamily II)
MSEASPTRRIPKQEQERASDEIIEVAPGILRAQLPIDFTGLGHVNCYLLEDRDGLAIVDPGLPGPSSYKALRQRLTAAGFPIERVHTVIVTHSHPDHFGGAGRVRHESGARIVTHHRFRLMWDPSEPPDVDVEDLPEVAELLGRRFPWDPTPWDGTQMTFSWRRKLALKASRHFPRLMHTPVPTVRLHEADTISLAGREWVAIHTPGHTEDHLCLFDPSEGVMLSGDHVLPTITPHVGGLSPLADPLDAFMQSLDKVASYGDDVSVVLPAHGHPFKDLTGRVESIKQHHIERLDQLRATAEQIGRPATVSEYSTHLFSARVQGTMADSETFAHLEHLRLLGEMERRVEPKPYQYVLVD